MSCDDSEAGGNRSANERTTLVLDVFDGTHCVKLEEESPSARNSPIHEVLFNEDILPEIMFQLRGLYEGNRWNQPVSQLLVVNKAFFHAGIGVLWQSMNSLKPAFKLLPWFNEAQYEGLGMHDYTGAGDWRRFNIYSSHIQRFTFEYSSKVDMAGPYVVELLTLPERPNPLFPNLQHVAISPLGFVGVPSLFFLITPSLRTFERMAGVPRDPLDTRDVQPDTASPSKELMAAFPRLAASSFQLHSFSYLGPTNDHFISRLCQLKALRTLRLAMTNMETSDALLYLHRLPLLEDLTVEGLCMAIQHKEDRRILDLPLGQKGMPKLQALSVFATQAGHTRVLASLGPSCLRQLRLRFFKATDPLMLQKCSLIYLERNRDIETFSVEFSCQHIKYYSPPIVMKATTQQRLATTAGFSHALNEFKNIRSFSFIDTPYALATANAPLILAAMNYWTTITHVSFRVRHGETTEPGTTSLSSPFPGLSFLASTVRNSCPNLLELELHFDRNLVVEEDLTPSMNACRRALNHPLRNLRVNTGTNRAESENLDLAQSRKADIAMMLESLFPNLEVVSGSGGGQWNEVGALVKAFRKHRVFILEGLMDGL